MKNQKRILMILLCLLLFTQVSIATKGDVEQLLKEKINFVNPIDAFTMYSFINYTGYDQENHTEFHPVRKGVRNDLIAKNINISRPNYFKDFGGYSMLEADMTSFIGWIGSRPNFKIDPKMRNALGMYVNGDLGDLDKMLTEFYREADIGNLYKKYKPYYDDVINKNQNEVYSSLAKTVNHFNLDIGKMRNFDIFINLLDMNFRGYMIDSLNIDPNTTKPYLMQIGPTPNNDINIHNVVHEFAHIFEAPIIRSWPKEFKKLNMALSYEYGSPSSENYQKWDQIVDESIVRAMTIWVMNGSRNDINNEMNQGFIMTEYI